MSTIGRVSRINPKSSILLLCDLQEKFRPIISYFPEIINNTQRLMKVSKILQIQMEATEHYPKGLGSTVEELNFSKYDIKPIPKMQFSMIIPEIESHIRNKESVILCGIAAHICVFQTVLDLVEMGSKQIYIPLDCVSSQSLVDRKLAFKRMNSFPDVHLTTLETLTLELIKSSSHPDFKACKSILELPAENIELLQAI